MLFQLHVFSQTWFRKKKTIQILIQFWFNRELIWKIIIKEQGETCLGKWQLKYTRGPRPRIFHYFTRKRSCPFFLLLRLFISSMLKIACRQMWFCQCFWATCLGRSGRLQWPPIPATYVHVLCKSRQRSLTQASVRPCQCKSKGGHWSHWAQPPSSTGLPERSSRLFSKSAVTSDLSCNSLPRNYFHTAS